MASRSCRVWERAVLSELAPAASGGSRAGDGTSEARARHEATRAMGPGVRASAAGPREWRHGATGTRQSPQLCPTVCPVPVGVTSRLGPGASQALFTLEKNLVFDYHSTFVCL